MKKKSKAESFKKYEKKTQQLFDKYHNNISKRNFNEAADLLYIDKVDYALKRMDNALSDLLREEFVFYTKKPKLLRGYSNATYYRKKRKAMEQFVDFLEKDFH